MRKIIFWQAEVVTGMNTLTDKATETVRAREVSFAGDRLCIELSDGRELSVPYKKIPWLKWLAKATPKQRADWSLEPGGYAIYWEQLDDGVEICHLLGMESLN
jgi:hypothetical protein